MKTVWCLDFRRPGTILNLLLVRQHTEKSLLKRRSTACLSSPLSRWEVAVERRSFFGPTVCQPVSVNCT